MKNVLLLSIFILSLCLQVNAQKFEWAKPFTGNAAGKKIIQDNDGYLYVTGYLSGTVDFDPSPAVANLTCGSTIRNTYIAKMDTSGNLIWIRQIEGSSNEPNDMVVDNQGNIIITGYFTGTVDMDPGLATQNITSAGLKDLHLIKLDNQGNYINHFRIGGAQTDYGAAIGTDVNGNVFIAGVYAYTVDVNPDVNVLNMVSTDSNNMFLLKFSNALTLLTAKKIESNYHTSRVLANDMKIDPSGNVYVTGEFRGTIDFDPSAGTANLGQTASYGTNGVFVCKYNNDLMYTWAKQFTYDCRTPSIGLSPLNEVYIHTSYKYVIDADPGINNILVYPENSLYSSMIIKLNTNGGYIWHKVFDLYTQRNVGGKSIYVDGNKSVTVCGQLYNAYSNRHSDFIEDSTIHTISQGTGLFNSGYLVQVDTAGNTMGVRTIQNNGNSSIQSIAISQSGGIYSTGVCQTTCDFNPGPGVFNLSGKGFVQKLSACNGSPSYSTLSFTACDSIKIHGEKYTKSGVYTHILPNAAGCDSIVSVNLTINKSYDSIMNLPHVCNSITINGVLYNTTGNYLQTYMTVNGCDSTIHINVVIHNTQQCNLPAVNQLSLNYWNHNHANAVWTYSDVDTFNVRYKATSSNTWNYLYNIKGKNTVLSGLQPSTQYEYQLMPACGCSPGYSQSKVWTTTTNCVSTSDLYNNNSIANAQLLPQNCEVTGTISSAADVDYYYFTQNSWQIISLTDLPANYDMEVYYPNGQLIASSHGFLNNDEYIRIDGNSNLVVKVFGVNNASSSSCYKLKIIKSEIVPCPITSPSVNNLTMPSWGDTYATLQWNPVFGASSYRYRIRQLGAYGWYTSGNIQNTIEYYPYLAPNTTYEWQLSTFCGYYTSSGFSPSKIFTTTSTCQSTFDGANNNSIASLSYIPFNTDVIGRLDVATDVDYYKIAIPSSSPIMISTTSLPANYQLSFYNSAMSHLYTSNSADTNAEYITINPPGGGDYYIRIQGVNGAFSASQCYKLKVINSSFPCNTPTVNSLNVSDVGNNYASLMWHAVPGALTYNIQYRVQGAASWTTVSNIASNVYMLTGLVPSTIYEWAIRANCTSGNSAYTSANVFTTTSICQGTYDDNLNNTSAGAKFIPADFPIIGSIDNMNDEDYYKINLFSGIPVHMTLYTQPADYKLTVYDAASNLLYTSNSYGTNAENITFTPNATGIYYVKVSGVQNSFSTSQCYTLKVNTSNIPCTAPVVSGLSLSMWGNTYATCIWNSVAGAVSYNLRYKATSSPTWNTLANLTGNMVELTGLIPATTYEVQLRSNCTSGASIYSTSKVFTTTANCQSTNDNNNNNTSFGAPTIPMNTNIYGMVTNSTDIDYYKFIVDAPSMVLHISLKNLPANYNLIIYNNNIQQLATSTTSGTADELMMITLPQGTYYIAVTPVNGSFNASACYTLKISNTGSYKQDESVTESSMVDAKSDIVVYPNPTQGIVNIDYELAADEEVSLFLLDLSGRVLYRKEFEFQLKGIHKEKIDLNLFDLPNGLYMLRIKTGQQDFRKKIEYQK